MKRIAIGCCLLLFSWAVPGAAQAASTPPWQFVEDEAEPATNVSFNVKSAASGLLSVVFDYRDTANFYALDCAPQAVTLRSVIGGVPHRLTSAAFTWPGTTTVLLKRRPWLMQVVINKQVVLTAYDASLSSGKIGAAARGGWSWNETRVQPVEKSLYFNDDFTRANGQSGEWKTLTGNWQLTASSERINTGNQEMSANPFSYQAVATSTLAFAQTGRWFWDNYEAQVSVRPSGAGASGLAVYVQDANNYLAFLWDAADGPQARRLVRVQGGKSTLLAKAGGGFLPRQWYRLAVRTSPGYVEAFIDGQTVFRVREDAFGSGGIGLLAQGTITNFDDVRVRSYDFFRQDFAGPTGGAWTPDGGFWRTDGGVLNSASRPGDRGATRVLLAGRPEWNGYQVSAGGKTGDNGAAGLMAGYRDDKNYLVYRWAAARSTLPFSGRAQLLRYNAGKAEILADAPAPAAARDGFLRVTMRFNAGAVTVLCNGEIVAQAADETLRAGRPGLWAQGTATVSFRDVVMFFPPESDPPKVAPRMENDALMVSWASASGEWPPRRVNNNLEHWNTGQFFGNASLEYTWRLPPAANNSNTWEAALRAQEGDFSSGYIVRVQGRDPLKISLARGATTLKSGDVTLSQIGASDSKPPRLRIELEGRAILVTANETPVISYLPDDGQDVPSGTRLAVRSTGYYLTARDLQAHSANRDDFTFNEAPVDWYSPQGKWSVFSRWPCYSDWSFFGGTGTAPVLWSKREYSGDTIVEMYAHPQMNLPKEIGYAHPGDLNLTLGGDGKTPASGYSFVLAGWFNTRSAILKGNSVVAQNEGANATFDRPINQNSEFHRRWFYIRAEARRTEKDGKNGVLLRFYVDNNLLAEYFDANPLPTIANGGRVAFWTVDGAMMIARAKIESEKPLARTLPAGLLDAAAQIPSTSRSGENDLAPVPLPMDGLPSSVVTADAEGWTIANPAAGGLFGVQLQPADGEKSLSMTRESRLSFDITLPPEVKLDWYLTVNGVRHLVELSGAQRPDARVKKLGAFNVTATAVEPSTHAVAWRHLEFELGRALHTMYPAASSWKIEKLEIGALHGDEYRWVGLFGNPLGAQYSLKNLRLTE